METKLQWEKKFFSNCYGIYSNGQQIGKLKNNSFSQTAEGELNGKKYRFKTKGFFQQHTEIIDRSENKVVGQITYNNWMTKAIISIDTNTINWKYDNLWNSRWRIFNSNGINIKYSGSSTSGQIDSSIDDALFMLTGLFVRNYYWQMTVAVMVAVLIPIWTTALQ